TEASAVRASSEKTKKEEHAALQREEGKITRRERILEETTKGLSDREKELPFALDAQKAAVTKFESRFSDLDRREKEQASALADLEKRESGFAAERLELRESGVELERARKELASDRKPAEAIQGARSD